MQSPALKETGQPSIPEPMNGRYDQLKTLSDACRELGGTIGQFFLDHQAEILRLYPGPMQEWSVEQQDDAVLWCIRLLERRIRPAALGTFGKGDFPPPRSFLGDGQKT